MLQCLRKSSHRRFWVRHTSNKTSPFASSLVANLTSEQKDFVLFDGPKAFVLSGPGTGKSHCIAAKMAYLKETKKAPLGSILALTSTENSAQVVRHLYDRVAPISSDTPQIMNLNSFVYKFMQQHSPNDVPQKVVSLFEQKLFFNEHESSFSLRNFKKATVYKLNLYEYFNRLLNLDITSKQYILYLDKVQIETAEKEKYGRNVEHTLEFLKIHYELANTFRKFTELKQIHNNYTVIDTLKMAQLVFVTNNDLVKRFNEQYKYIFLDDVQNLTVLQYYFLKHLLNSDSSSWSFIGDDEQAINRENGAKSNVIQELLDQYQMPVFKLTKNHRNNPIILEASQKLMAKLNKPGIRKNIDIPRETSINPESNSVKPLESIFLGNPLIVRGTQTLTDEVYEVLSTIKYIKSNDPNSTIAVFTSGSRFNKSVVEALATNRISTSGRRSLDLESNTIKLLLSFLYLLVPDCPNKNTFEVMTSKIYNISSQVATELLEEALKKDQLLSTYLFSGEAICSDPNVQYFVDDIKQFSKNVHNSTLVDLISDLLTKKHFDPIRDPQNENDSHEYTSVESFLNLIKKISTYKQEIAQHTPTFIPYLRKMAEAGKLDPKEIEDESAVYTTFTQFANNLEFDYVIITQCARTNFPGFFQYQNLQVPKGLSTEEPLDLETFNDDKRKLLYTLITRARKTVVFTYTPKVSKPSKFILESMGLNEKTFSLSDTQINPESVSDSSVLSTWKTNLDLRYKLSPNAIDINEFRTYLRCPVMYGLKHVLSIESEKISSYQNQFLTYQSALRNVWTLVHSNKCTDLHIPDLNNVFFQTYINKGYLKELIDGTSYSIGLQEIETLYQQISESNKLNYFTEIPFEVSIGPEAFKITGKIDSAYIEGDFIEIRQFIIHDENTDDLDFSKHSAIATILAEGAKQYFKDHKGNVIHVKLSYTRGKHLSSSRLLTIRNSKEEIKSEKFVNLISEIKGGIFTRKSEDYELCNRCVYRKKCPQSLFTKKLVAEEKTK